MDKCKEKGCVFVPKSNGFCFGHQYLLSTKERQREKRNLERNIRVNPANKVERVLVCKKCRKEFTVWGNTKFRTYCGSPCTRYYNRKRNPEEKKTWMKEYMKKYYHDVTKRKMESDPEFKRANAERMKELSRMARLKNKSKELKRKAESLSKIR